MRVDDIDIVRGDPSAHRPHTRDMLAADEQGLHRYAAAPRFVVNARILWTEQLHVMTTSDEAGRFFQHAYLLAAPTAR